MKNNYSQFDFQFKILLLGDAGVGKTALMGRFSDNRFFENYLATIGCDFKIKSLELDGEIIRLQLWDTAGQERFRIITSSYYRGADGIALIYDATNPTSFQNLPRWIEEIKRNALDTVSLLIISNKTDLKSQILVSEEEGKAYAESIGSRLFLCSAKTGENVYNAFSTFSREIRQKIKAQKPLPHPKNNQLPLQKEQNKLPQKSGCCK